MVSLRSGSPYVALFVTWLMALVAYNLARPPSPSFFAVSMVYWIGLSLLYAVALGVGYRQHGKPPKQGAIAARAGFLLGGVLLSLAFNGASYATLFYIVVAIQISLGFVLTSVRSLHASLAVSCVLLAFTASRPHADIPLLLTLPFFTIGFILTLVSAQVGAFRERAGSTAFVSPRRTWLGISFLVLLATLVLGTLILFTTPIPGPGPLEWTLDREYLSQHKLIPGDGPAATDGPGETVGGSGGQSTGSALEAAAQAFSQKLAQARTLLDVAAAAGAAASTLGLALAKDYPLWWLWPLALLLIAVIAQPGARLRVRTQWDRLLLRHRLNYYSQAAKAPAVAQAWGRLLQLRNIPRPPYQTWSQHAESTTGVTPETKALLEGFAHTYDALAYGRAEEEQVHPLPRIYLKAFSYIRREPLNGKSGI